MGILTQISREDVLRALNESGSSQEMSDNIMDLYEHNQIKELIPILKRHKQTLLAKMHESQSAVDQFDFMVYRLEQSAKQKEIK